MSARISTVIFWVKPCGKRLEIMKGGKGDARQPKIPVLGSWGTRACVTRTCHARCPPLSGYSGTVELTLPGSNRPIPAESGRFRNAKIGAVCCGAWHIVRRETFPHEIVPHGLREFGCHAAERPCTFGITGARLTAGRARSRRHQAACTCSRSYCSAPTESWRCARPALFKPLTARTKKTGSNPLQKAAIYAYD